MQGEVHARGCRVASGVAAHVTRAVDCSVPVVEAAQDSPHRRARVPEVSARGVARPRDDRQRVCRRCVQARVLAAWQLRAREWRAGAARLAAAVVHAQARAQERAVAALRVRALGAVRRRKRRATAESHRSACVCVCCELFSDCRTCATRRWPCRRAFLLLRILCAWAVYTHTRRRHRVTMREADALALRSAAHRGLSRWRLQLCAAKRAGAAATAAVAAVTLYRKVSALRAWTANARFRRSERAATAYYANRLLEGALGGWHSVALRRAHARRAGAALAASVRRTVLARSLVAWVRVRRALVSAGRGTRNQLIAVLSAWHGARALAPPIQAARVSRWWAYAGWAVERVAFRAVQQAAEVTLGRRRQRHALRVLAAAAGAGRVAVRASGLGRRAALARRVAAWRRFVLARRAHHAAVAAGAAHWGTRAERGALARWRRRTVRAARGLRTGGRGISLSLAQRAVRVLRRALQLCSRRLRRQCFSAWCALVSERRARAKVDAAVDAHARGWASRRALRSWTAWTRAARSRRMLDALVRADAESRAAAPLLQLTCHWRRRTLPRGSASFAAACACCARQRRRRVRTPSPIARTRRFSAAAFSRRGGCTLRSAMPRRSACSWRSGLIGRSRCAKRSECGAPAQRCSADCLPSARGACGGARLCVPVHGPATRARGARSARCEKRGTHMRGRCAARGARMTPPRLTVWAQWALRSAVRQWSAVASSRAADRTVVAVGAAHWRRRCLRRAVAQLRHHARVRAHVRSALGVSGAHASTTAAARVMRRWVAHTEAAARLGVRATTHHGRVLVRKSFTTWQCWVRDAQHYARSAVRATRAHSHRLLSKAFAQWGDWVAHQRRSVFLNTAADSIYERSLMLRSIVRWRRWRARVREAGASGHGAAYNDGTAAVEFKARTAAALAVARIMPGRRRKLGGARRLPRALGEDGRQRDEGGAVVVGSGRVAPSVTASDGAAEWAVGLSGMSNAAAKRAVLDRWERWATGAWLLRRQVAMATRHHTEGVMRRAVEGWCDTHTRARASVVVAQSRVVVAQS